MTTIGASLMPTSDAPPRENWHGATKDGRVETLPHIVAIGVGLISGDTPTRMLLGERLR